MLKPILHSSWTAIANRLPHYYCSSYWAMPMLLGLTWWLWSSAPAFAMGGIATNLHWPFWQMAIALFLLSAAIGMIAVVVGIGGGVLYVPIANMLFPNIHIDFIRGGGLFVVLAGGLSAAPALLRGNLVHLRLALPLALVGSIGSVVGSHVGLQAEAHWVQLGLAAWIFSMVLVMLRPTKQKAEQATSSGYLPPWLGWQKRVFDVEKQEVSINQPRRVWFAGTLFLLSGFLGGFFGIGAGFINVPLMHIMMGLPLKWSVATSYFLISAVNSAAALVYLQKGAVAPLIATPSILGVMLGATLGARFLKKGKNKQIHYVIITVLTIAASMALVRGLDAYSKAGI